MRPNTHVTPRGSHCSIDKDLSEEDLLMSPYTPQVQLDKLEAQQETQKKKQSKMVTVHRERTELKEKSRSNKARIISQKDQQIRRLLLEVRMLTKEINKMHPGRSSEGVTQFDEKWVDHNVVMYHEKEAQQKQQQQRFLQQNNLQLYQHLKEQKHFNRILLKKVDSLTVCNANQAHKIKEQEYRMNEMKRENAKLMEAVGQCMAKEREEMKIIRTMHRVLSESKKRQRSRSRRKQEGANKMEKNTRRSEQIQHILASKLNLADCRKTNVS